MVEGRFVDSNMDDFFSFISNLFAAMAYSLEVGDVGSGVFIGNAVYINCTGDITITFFYSIFQASVGFSYVGKVVILFQAGPFVDYVFFWLWWNFILRMIRIVLKVFAAFKLTSVRWLDLVNNNVTFSIPYVPGLSEEFQETFNIPLCMPSSKEPAPLNYVQNPGFSKGIQKYCMVFTRVFMKAQWMSKGFFENPWVFSRGILKPHILWKDFCQILRVSARILWKLLGFHKAFHRVYRVLQKPATSLWVLQEFSCKIFGVLLGFL